MAVDFKHRSYREFESRWIRCRDAYEGSDAVKARSTLYLPLLEGQDTGGTGYNGYLRRALFYPATGRTVNGLAGLVFAKPPTVAKVPVANRDDFDDVTLTGITLGAFGALMCREILITGRVGVLLDMAERGGDRPYWAMYTAERIINWQTQRNVDGQIVLTMVVLEEDIEVADPKDAFELKVHKQYRVLQLIDGKYTVTIWHENENQKGAWVAGPPTIPVRRGIALDFIPFVMAGADGVEIRVTPPPLLALVDVNLSHYCTSADHEHGAHYTALPTPYVTGMNPEQAGGKLTIGSGEAWIIPQPTASVGMLEFSGSGLGALAALKEEKRLLMATLGARMLETQKADAEAADTVRLRHAGESSAMSVIADALGGALSQLLDWHLWWSGLESVEPEVTMNPDVMDNLSPEDVRVLVDTWQKGVISKRTLHYNLAWGEWTRPGVTFEDEEKEIAEEEKDKPKPEVIVPPVVPPVKPGTP